MRYNPDAASSSGSHRPKVIAVALVVLAVVAGIVLWPAFAGSEAGTVTVIRNGGPFDDREVRTTIPEASSRKFIGLLSKKHPYPASERYYTMTADPARADSAGGAVSTVKVPTSDGVEVSIEGTLFFTVPQEPKSIEAFDERFGTRTYPYLTKDGEQKQLHAWEGTEGWAAFLDAVVRPIVYSNVRQQIGDFRCVDMQASCALVQNASLKPSEAAKLADKHANGLNNETLQKVQDAVVESLKSDFRRKLGGDYLTNLRFSMGGVHLPGPLQTEITNAQGSFAKISTSQANLNAAQLDATANEERQRGYEKCPACAQIDVMKAIPPTITTYAPGAGAGIAVVPQPAPAKK